MMYSKILTIALLTITFAGCGRKAQTGMGPLSDIITARSDDSWSVRYDGDAVAMDNSNAPGAITYYFVDPRPGEEGSRMVSVEVALVRPQPGSRAGLLYGFESDPRSYFMFTVDSDRNVGLSYFENGNLEQRFSSNFSGLDLRGARLAIRENGSSISLMVNEKEVSQFSNSRIGRGAVGIVAIDVGGYRFNSFDIEAPRAPASPAPSQSPSTPTARKEAIAPPKPSQTKNWTFHNVVDPTDGMVQRRVPLPPGWSLDSEQNFIGPNGIRTLAPQYYNYMYSNDPFAMETIRMMGGQSVAPLMSIEDYLKNAVVPALSQRGYQLTTSYPLPEMTAYTRRSYAMSPTLLSRDVRSIGTEWERRDGKLSFIILTQSVRQLGPLIQWTLFSTEVEAPAGQLTQAKEVVMQALAQTEFNAQWQQREEYKFQQSQARNNQFWSEMTRQSAAAHQSRMQAIQARGAASSAAAKTYSDILDINHAGYLNRSNMVDAGQERSVNAISGHSVISNGSERYRVETGSNHYWVNNQGEYFGTDNSLYDPRTDSRVNNQQWTPFQVEE